MIFGSNYIEKVGSTYDITLKICLDILAGNSVPEEIPDRDPEYLAAREHLRNAGLSSDYKAVVRSRKEIIQHTQALKYIVTQLVIFNNPLTEDIIEKTHHILCNGITLDDGQDEIEYAGLYRTVNVVAGLHGFMPPAQVPMAMRMMVREFNNDITKAENDGVIDPFSLAAKYCHKFVNIHPFVDGNGRTCRLILNAVLLKYAGIVISLGDQDCDRYLEIATKASMIEQMDEEERDSRKPAWAELASHVVLNASKKFQTFRNKLRA
jgi:Fic family protein